MDQAIGILGRAAPAQTDQRVQVILSIDLDHRIGHVEDLAADRHLVRLVPAGAQDGAAHGQQARQRLAIQGDVAVLHEAAEAVLETHDRPAVFMDRRLPHGADGGIEAGAVAPRSQNTDGFRHAVSV